MFKDICSISFPFLIYTCELYEWNKMSRKQEECLETKQEWQETKQNKTRMSSSVVSFNNGFFYKKYVKK